MKTFCAVLGYISIIWMALTGIAYWTNLWGGIGFFGSLLTTPFSQIIAMVLIMFSSIEYFIQTIVWISITALLLAYASTE